MIYSAEQKGIDELQNVEWMVREIRINKDKKINGPKKQQFSIEKKISTHFLVIFYRFIKYKKLILG